MSELTFEQMLDASLKTIHAGEVVEGTVIDVKPEEAVLNIGCKSDGILTRNEYSNDSNLDLTMGLLRTYVAKNNAAALVTLHDPSLALNYCDTLLVLSDCGLLGELQPFSTPISKMEPLLSSIYGTISLTTLSTRSGEKRLIMIKEDDAC